jgi:LysR family transcriptional activator of nhaA
MLRPDQLNFQHLRYFWAVVQEGSVTDAARRLHVTQSTVSTQLRKLERDLGGRLLRKRGRGVEPTELGGLVAEHAGRIFELGQDLVEAVRSQAQGLPVRFVVGATDVLPKIAVQSILRGLLGADGPAVHLVVHEGKPDQLLADLAVHRLDLVLSDRPVAPGSAVRAYHHDLGSCPVALFARPRLAQRLVDGFPHSLDGAPMVLPTSSAALRGPLEEWFARTGVAPRVVAEVEDSALLKRFGQQEDCVFPAPLGLEAEVAAQYQVRRIGVVEAVLERFYAISLERRVRHPGVLRILESSPFQD